MNKIDLICEIQRLDQEAVLLEVESKDNALELWKKALDLLQSHAASIEDDAACNYLSAYIAYMIWARTSDEALWERSLRSAKKCLMSNNNDSLAKFVLLCLYFDRAFYESAYDLVFTNVDVQYFHSIGQDWRTAKAVEMRFAASLMFKPEESVSLAQELYDRYSELNMPEGIMPISAGRLLEEWLNKVPLCGSKKDWQTLCLLIYNCSEISQSVKLMKERFPRLAQCWADLRLFHEE